LVVFKKWAGYNMGISLNTVYFEVYYLDSQL
jgi:hypothetical protein